MRARRRSPWHPQRPRHSRCARAALCRARANTSARGPWRERRRRGGATQAPDEPPRDTRGSIISVSERRPSSVRIRGTLPIGLVARYSPSRDGRTDTSSLPLFGQGLWPVTYCACNSRSCWARSSHTPCRSRSGSGASAGSPATTPGSRRAPRSRWARRVRAVSRRTSVAVPPGGDAARGGGVRGDRDQPRALGTDIQTLGHELRDNR